MSDSATLESASTQDAYVLLGLVSLAEADECPAPSPDVRRACLDLPDPEGVVVGTLSEADATKALYRLEEDGLVEEVDRGEPSPMGKGRPEYEPAVEPDAVLEAAREDPGLEPVAEELERR